MATSIDTLSGEPYSCGRRLVAYPRGTVYMAEERLRRKLAAILSADVVGYSRLMGIDEAGTVSRLNALRRELIDPAISRRKFCRRNRRPRPKNGAAGINGEPAMRISRRSGFTSGSGVLISLRRRPRVRHASRRWAVTRSRARRTC